MFSKFFKNGNFALLQESIENGDNCSVFGLNIGEKLALLSSSAILFYVVDSIESGAEVLDKFVELGRRPYLLTDALNPLSSEFEKSENILEFLTLMMQKK